MKSITLLLIPLLFLSSCTIDWNDSFEKKQKCASYISSIENRIQKDKKELNTNGEYYNETLDEIFYSQERKSCIAIMDLIMKNSWGTVYKKIIHDILSNNRETYDKQNTDSISSYNMKLKELKWE